MRLSWAIAAGLVAGAALGWWLLREEVAPDGPPTPSQAVGAPQDAQAAGPRLYRWRDASGVLHVSDTPPAEGPYEEVQIPAEQNVVPMSGPAPEPEPEPEPVAPGD